MFASRYEDDLARGIQDLTCMERNIGPLDFVVVSAMLDVREILGKNAGHIGGLGCQEHRLHPIGISRAADIRPLMVSADA